MLRIESARLRINAANKSLRVLHLCIDVSIIMTFQTH